MTDLTALLTFLIPGSALALGLAAGWRFLLDLVVDHDR